MTHLKTNDSDNDHNEATMLCGFLKKKTVDRRKSPNLLMIWDKVPLPSQKQHPGYRQTGVQFTVLHTVVQTQQKSYRVIATFSPFLPNPIICFCFPS